MVDFVGADELWGDIRRRINGRMRARPIIATFGDSRAIYGNSGTYRDHNSWQAWAMALSGGLVTFPVDRIFGYPGQNTNTILTHLSEVIACDADHVIWLASTNDRSDGMTLEQTIANYITVMTEIPKSGKRVTMLTDLPRGVEGQSAGFTGVTLARHLAQRRWLLDNQDKYPGVLVLDTWPTFVDPASTEARAKVGLSYDGAHLNPLGAYTLGKLVADHLARIYPIARRPYAVANADVYDAAENPKGSVTNNPMMLGTGGTFGADASGVAATGIQIIGTAGATCVASKQVDADGVEWQRLTIGGTPSTATAIQIRNPITTTKLLQGDVIHSQAEIRIDANQPYEAVSLFLETTTGASQSARFMSPTASDYMQIIEHGPAVYTTDEITIPAGTTTVARSTIYIALKQSAVADLIVDVRCWETKKS